MFLTFMSAVVVAIFINNNIIFRWSFGVLLWEIYTLGCNPYPDVQREEIAKHIYDGYRMSRPKLCPICVYELMQLCWRKNAENRPNFLYIVKELDSLILSNVRYRPRNSFKF